MNSYMISRYEDAERACKDPTFNSDNHEWQFEPVHGPTIRQMEGRDHSRHRNLVTPAFRGADLREKFMPVVERSRPGRPVRPPGRSGRSTPRLPSDDRPTAGRNQQ